MANESTKANLELFYNIEVFLGCTCIIPMLECVQSPSKFTETHHAFSCDFIVVFNSCEGGFYHSIGMNKPNILGIMMLVNFLTLWTIG